MVFATILKYLPMGDNMKVAFGTSVVLAISYATLARKGTSYDNMAEKREAMKNQELADREAVRAARAAKPDSSILKRKNNFSTRTHM